LFFCHKTIAKYVPQVYWLLIIGKIRLNARKKGRDETIERQIVNQLMAYRNQALKKY
jgi:hypothetical protein